MRGKVREVWQPELSLRVADPLATFAESGGGRRRARAAAPSAKAEKRSPSKEGMLKAAGYVKSERAEAAVEVGSWYRRAEPPLVEAFLKEKKKKHWARLSRVR